MLKRTSNERRPRISDKIERSRTGSEMSTCSQRLIERLKRGKIIRICCELRKIMLKWWLIGRRKRERSRGKLTDSRLGRCRIEISRKRSKWTRLSTITLK